MKQALLFFLVILLVTACSDKDNTKSVCNVQDPINDLAWLRTELEQSDLQSSSSIMDVSVYQAFYLGQPVFFISTCCPACNLAPPSVRSCDGSVIGTIGVDVNPESLNGAEVIWRTNNGVCP